MSPTQTPGRFFILLGTDNTGAKLLIPVIYRNGELGEVTPSELARLIESKEIIRFKRSSGWVDINKGPIRAIRPSRKTLPL